MSGRLIDGVRIACPACGDDVTVRPRSMTYEQPHPTDPISVRVELLGLHRCTTPEPSR